MKSFPYIEVSIEEYFTTFYVSNGTGSAPELLHKVNIGYKIIADKYFKNFPPTYDDVDYAINHTEEIIVPLHNSIDGNITLYSNDPMLKEIINLAFNTYKDKNDILTLPTVELENVFNRLSDIIKGLPASQDVIPQNTSFAAYLLILREILHHLHFKEIKWALGKEILAKSFG